MHPQATPTTSPAWRTCSSLCRGARPRGRGCFDGPPAHREVRRPIPPARQVALDCEYRQRTPLFVPRRQPSLAQGESHPVARDQFAVCMPNSLTSISESQRIPSCSQSVDPSAGALQASPTPLFPISHYVPAPLAQLRSRSDRVLPAKPGPPSKLSAPHRRSPPETPMPPRPHRLGFTTERPAPMGRAYRPPKTPGPLCRELRMPQPLTTRSLHGIPGDERSSRSGSLCASSGDGTPTEQPIAELVKGQPGWSGVIGPGSSCIGRGPVLVGVLPFKDRQPAFVAPHPAVVARTQYHSPTHRACSLPTACVGSFQTEVISPVVCPHEWQHGTLHLPSLRSAVAPSSVPRAAPAATTGSRSRLGVSASGAWSCRGAHPTLGSRPSRLHACIAPGSATDRYEEVWRPACLMPAPARTEENHWLDRRHPRSTHAWLAQSQDPELRAAALPAVPGGAQDDGKAFAQSPGALSLANHCSIRVEIGRRGAPGISKGQVSKL